MWQGLKKNIRKQVYRWITPPHQFVFNSYSQAGEDAIISFLFNDIKLSNPSYLDIGTGNPDWGNNTYKFYCSDSRGVLVEADETLIPTIIAKRPEDKIINAGVSLSGNQKQDFYIFEITGLNTFVKEEAEYREKKGPYKIVRKVEVSLITINEIIKENFSSYPDFLSIDIEGLDLAVLKTLDFDKYPIPVICAETCKYSENNIRPKDTSIAEFMRNKGYFAYADTYINTIFVNEAWFLSKAK